MNSAYVKLIRYIEATERLARAIEADLKKGGQLTSSSVNALSKYKVAETSMAKMLAIIEKKGTRLN